MGQKNFELIAEVGEFIEVGRMDEHISEAGLVVLELGLCERQVLLQFLAVVACLAGDSFQSIQNRSRAVVIAR